MKYKHGIVLSIFLIMVIVFGLVVFQYGPPGYLATCIFGATLGFFYKKIWNFTLGRLFWRLEE